MASLVRELSEEAEILAAGVGAPGPLREGRLLTPPNLPGWHGFPLREEWSRRLGVKVALERDSNAALLGEVWRGRARGEREVLLLTLGTGVGGAVLTRGELLRGRDGMAGELGHILVEPEGPACGSGHRGCLEALISGPSIGRQAGMPPEEVFARARGGDPQARSQVERMARYLGMALASLVHIFNPALILLGGGLSREAPLFLPLAEEEMKNRVFPSLSRELKIAPAGLGEEAGLYGAGLLALEEAGIGP
jgi:glucokinase